MQKTHNTQITDEFQFSLIFSCLFSFLTFFFFNGSPLSLLNVPSCFSSCFLFAFRCSFALNFLFRVELKKFHFYNQEYVRVQSSFVSNESLIIRILILRPTIYADTSVFIYKHTILNHINCWKERLSFV